jgi:hypothetical protein
MKKKHHKKDWLTPKGYIHFTRKLDSAGGESRKFLHSYVKNISAVKKHAFYPLIHRKLVSRRYKKIGVNAFGKTLRAHSIKDETGKTKSNAKERNIYYSTHIDAVIYGYYTQVILTPLYESKVLKVPGLSDCISAYRKIPIGNEVQGNKNNIHFADDVFRYIKAQKDCTVLTFDVSSFFDTLNHAYLKKQWYSLLKKTTLPEDHYNIYKSLTNFSYVEFYRVLKEFNIKSDAKLRQKKIFSFCDTPAIFRNRVKAKGYIKHHPFKDEDKNLCGIPQGTPISAFLANLYMFEFDQEIFSLINSKEYGLYRRYSDDIVVVCKTSNVLEIKQHILDIIKTKYKLTINKDKVSESIFTTSTDDVLRCDKPLTYLGFTFDGQKALIKSASLAKFYRQLKASVKANAKKAEYSLKTKKGKSKNSMIHKSKLFKKFSHLGNKGSKRNFVIYAQQAAETMQEDAIKKQLSQFWGNLNEEIKKYEKRLESDKVKQGKLSTAD